MTRRDSGALEYYRRTIVSRLYFVIKLIHSAYTTRCSQSEFKICKSSMCTLFLYNWTLIILCAHKPRMRERSVRCIQARVGPGPLIDSFTFWVIYFVGEILNFLKLSEMTYLSHLKKTLCSVMSWMFELDYFVCTLCLRIETKYFTCASILMLVQCTHHSGSCIWRIKISVHYFVLIYLHNY